MNNYNNLIFKNKPKYLLLWLIVIILVLASFILISVFYKYNKFYHINGLNIKEGSDNYVQILVPLDKMDIIKTFNLIINNKETNFKYNINTNFYNNNNQVFKEIRVEFNNNYLNGELVNLTFLSSKTTFMKEIKRKLEGNG